MAPLARDAREQHEQCLACATAKCYESCTASHPGVAVVGEHLELRVVDDCPTVCGDIAQSWPFGRLEPRDATLFALDPVANTQRAVWTWTSTFPKVSQIYPGVEWSYGATAMVADDTRVYWADYAEDNTALRIARIRPFAHALGSDPGREFIAVYLFDDAGAPLEAPAGAQHRHPGARLQGRDVRGRPRVERP